VRDSCVEIAPQGERRAKSNLDLSVAWINLDSLSQDFRPALDLSKIGECATGAANARRTGPSGSCRSGMPRLRLEHHQIKRL
jgi:hypothetical protein